VPRVGRVRAAPRVGAPAGHLGGDEGLSNQDLRALRKYPSREIGWLQNGLVVMQLRRLAAHWDTHEIMERQTGLEHDHWPALMRSQIREVELAQHQVTRR
jgi:hypothetical protein